METHGSDRSGRLIPMDRGITIKDIATRLGVHHTTVSRALRNHPDVNSKTRESVIKMARKLDYQPSSIARNFRTSRSTVIGLIVPNIHHHFFSHIISMITDMAYHHGFTVMTCQSNDDMHHEEQIIQSLIRNRVAGVLASIAQNNCRSDHYQALKARGIPLVFFDRFCQDLDVPKVSADNESGSAMAVNHLVGRDRKKIAIITGSCMVNVFAERLKGFKTALKHHGISPNEAFIVETGTEIYDGYEAAKYLMQRENRPDAVITVSFSQGCGVLKYTREEGIRVPEEVALLTFGEDPMSTMLVPSLTTISQSRQLMATRAFELMQQMIDVNTTGSGETVRLEPELIVRNST